jgi:uncharacterized protein YndB with AHSA1/START domain
MFLNDKLNITTPSDNELEWTREFNASRNLVFDALSKPELIRLWLLGPDGWTMPICEIDFKVGGKYRYVWSNPEKDEMGMGGIFKEIILLEKIVSTERFEQSWYPGEAIGTVTLSGNDSKTILKTNMLYESKESRDAVLKSGMEQGLVAGYNRLAEVLASIVKREYGI